MNYIFGSASGSASLDCSFDVAFVLLLPFINLSGCSGLGVVVTRNSVDYRACDGKNA